MKFVGCVVFLALLLVACDPNEKQRAELNLKTTSTITPFWMTTAWTRSPWRELL
jgi:hypothetical protein